MVVVVVVDKQPPTAVTETVPQLMFHCSVLPFAAHRIVNLSPFTRITQAASPSTKTESPTETPEEAPELNTSRKLLTISQQTRVSKASSIKIHGLGDGTHQKKLTNKGDQNEC